MDVTIVTTGPGDVSVTEVADALEKAGYLVFTVTLVDREGNEIEKAYFG